MSAFRPIEGPWGYAHDAADFVEAHNCAQGCRRALADPAGFEEFGPGARCELLAAIYVQDEIPEMEWVGDVVTCQVREPL